MSLLELLRNPGHIGEAIVHINSALDRLEGSAPKTEVSRTLFDALNKIQTEWVLQQTVGDVGEVKAFQLMISEGLETCSRKEFVLSPDLKKVVFFEPQILDHSVLKSRNYRPGSDISSDLQKKATQVHRKLVTAYRDYAGQSSEQEEQRVLKRAAELLYVVRSNIAHGEKTPYGSDTRKKERDELVCGTILPVQLALIDLLLSHPDEKLIVYGTMAPGMPNHDILSGLKGHWQKSRVKGHIDFVDGLSFFEWDPSGVELEVQLFVSRELPSYWHRIDKFEGNRYKRRLLPVFADIGISVANAYLRVPHREMHGCPEN